VFAHVSGHLIRMIQPTDKLSEVNWQESSRRARCSSNRHQAREAEPVLDRREEVEMSPA
jgi:hypothetical protein